MLARVNSCNKVSMVFGGESENFLKVLLRLEIGSGKMMQIRPNEGIFNLFT
jgi:hypothetical protein